jgi:hypothetical protein
MFAGKKLLISLVFLSVLCGPLAAQDADPEAAHAWIGSIGAMANTQDLFLTGNAGCMIIPKWQVSLQLAAYWRPFDKTVFEEKSKNWYYQYKEERLGLALLAEIPFLIPDTSFGFYAAGGAGVSMGNYKGTSASAKSQGTPIAKVGVQYGRSFFIRAGYQYMNIPHLPSNWGTCEIGYSF